MSSLASISQGSFDLPDILGAIQETATPVRNRDTTHPSTSEWPLRTWQPKGPALGVGQAGLGNGPFHMVQCVVTFRAHWEKQHNRILRNYA